MPLTDRAPRAGTDACPGVLRLTESADGWLARVRLPGGFVSRRGISTLTALASEVGDGRLELTSRGNVQVRGLPADAGNRLGQTLHTCGLWPSQTHERVRNIVASPLAGLDRPLDLSGLVAGLDAALCAQPRLAQLSGRFLFAVDDGRGDVTGLGADVLVQHHDSRHPPWSVNGMPVPDPVAAAVAAAYAFLDERAAQGGTAWRVADLDQGMERVRERLATRLGLDGQGARTTTPVCGPPLAGLLPQVSGGHAVVLAVPLGRLDAAQTSWLASIVGSRPARVTPWRTIVVPDVEPACAEAAAAMGFGVTPDSPWLGISACAGQPRCAKALADVQRDARRDLGRWPGRVVHWSGCERRCGRPARTEIDVVAAPSGYRVEGVDA